MIYQQNSLKYFYTYLGPVFQYQNKCVLSQYSQMSQSIASASHFLPVTSVHEDTSVMHPMDTECSSSISTLDSQDIAGADSPPAQTPDIPGPRTNFPEKDFTPAPRKRRGKRMVRNEASHVPMTSSSPAPVCGPSVTFEDDLETCNVFQYGHLTMPEPLHARLLGEYNALQVAFGSAGCDHLAHLVEPLTQSVCATIEEAARPALHGSALFPSSHLQVTGFTQADVTQPERVLTEVIRMTKKLGVLADVPQLRRRLKDGTAVLNPDTAHAVGLLVPLVATYWFGPSALRNGVQRVLPAFSKIAASVFVKKARYLVVGLRVSPNCDALVQSQFQSVAVVRGCCQTSDTAALWAFWHAVMDHGLGAGLPPAALVTLDFDHVSNGPEGMHKGGQELYARVWVIAAHGSEVHNRAIKCYKLPDQAVCSTPYYMAGFNLQWYDSTMAFRHYRRTATVADSERGVTRISNLPCHINGHTIMKLLLTSEVNRQLLGLGPRRNISKLLTVFVHPSRTGSWSAELLWFAAPDSHFDWTPLRPVCHTLAVVHSALYQPLVGLQRIITAGRRNVRSPPRNSPAVPARTHNQPYLYSRSGHPPPLASVGRATSPGFPRGPTPPSSSLSGVGPWGATGRIDPDVARGAWPRPGESPSPGPQDPSGHVSSRGVSRSSAPSGRERMPSSLPVDVPMSSAEPTGVEVVRRAHGADVSLSLTPEVQGVMERAVEVRVAGMASQFAQALQTLTANQEAFQLTTMTTLQAVQEDNTALRAVVTANHSRQTGLEDNFAALLQEFRHTRTQNQEFLEILRSQSRLEVLPAPVQADPVVIMPVPVQDDSVVMRDVEGLVTGTRTASEADATNPRSKKVRDGDSTTTGGRTPASGT